MASDARLVLRFVSWLRDNYPRDLNVIPDNELIHYFQMWSSKFGRKSIGEIMRKKKKKS